MRRSPLIPRPRRRVGLIVLLLALVVALVGPLLPVRPAAVGAETVGAGTVGAGTLWAERAGAETTWAETVRAAGAVEVSDDDPPSPWVWPTGTREVVRPWEAPASDYAAGHRGIDLAAPLGTPAVAVADGTVSFAGQVAGRGVVTIDHGDGLLSTLDSVEPSVRTGDTVEQGAAVGVFTVGHCPAVAACVHLGARVDGRYVDPLPFLPPAAWPVLLPESAWPG